MCQSCLDRTNKNSKRQTQEYRQKVIEAYGGACMCCGITVEKYLQLDHVNNDGNVHRKQIRRYNNGGLSYSWACQNGFPPILQLLCANCHQAKSRHKPCTKEDHLQIFVIRRSGVHRPDPL